MAGLKLQMVADFGLNPAPLDTGRALVLGSVVAGVFGFGVAKHMSPYGADDPSTQSVQARHRFETASGRQLDPGIVALVRSGEVSGAPARSRVRVTA